MLHGVAISGGMESPSSQLVPPPTKGHASVVRLPREWYVACTSSELGKAPLSRTVLGIPLVLFRDAEGRAAALLDRCPHRNAPLSAGRVVDGQVECRYHGWRFDGAGECRRVPVSCGPTDAKARRTPSFPVAEQNGYVWVFATADTEPPSLPREVPFADNPAYTVVQRHFTVESTMHAAIENTLDVPHTAFLHRGLFRKERAPQEITAVVRSIPGGIEAEFLGEARPPGVVGKVLAPGGGVVIHFDRFLLPCITQVEYRLGDRSHLMVTTAYTPESDFVTRVYATVTFRLPIPEWLVTPILTPIAVRIFQQDARMLKLQSDTIRRFGGEQFASTEVDLLGPHIWRLLRQAERGAVVEARPEERVSMQL